MIRFNRTFTIKIIVFGLAVWFILTWLTRLILADDPTPTPPVGEESEPCRLAQGHSCDFSDLTEGIGVSGAGIKTNPALGAQDVPTYTLVAITFDRDINPATLNNDTFYVNQGATRVAGVVDYLAVSRMAVFYPAEPLLPNTTYTATVTTGVTDEVGQPLTGTEVWTFTTWVEPFAVQGGLDAAGVSTAGTMHVYFGDLHSHTGYSDGQGTPAQAFAAARANGLHFFAVTDHDFMLTEVEWQEVLTQANAATVNGAFVGLRGFEFTHPQGHLNVFNTAALTRYDDPAYQNFNNFYNWLLAQPGAIGQFNHPQVDFNFDNFAYQPPADLAIVLRELSTADQFFLSLNAGWHVGTLLNSDTHSANWGQRRFMGVVAPGLTKTDILDALRARRTFFVPPDGQHLALVMQANGYWMGAAIPNPPALNFIVNAYDPDGGGRPLYLNLYDNGLVVASATLPGTASTTWQPVAPAKLGHYYYVEAYHSGWTYAAYSSPVWVEQPPIAEAGPPQTIAPGAVVTLNGSGSWAPARQALAYYWRQNSGPAVSLNQNDAAQATFSAVGVGEIIFTLAVTDAGGLSHTDTTVVTVTDKPILTITKVGPETARPGEPVTYTLTVTNSGITPAKNVVITDAVPLRANYVSGGALLPGNIVSWTLPSLAANNGSAQVTFTVTTTGALVNYDYRVSCAEGVSARGAAVFTNGRRYYMPIIVKTR